MMISLVNRPIKRAICLVLMLAVTAAIEANAGDASLGDILQRRQAATSGSDTNISSSTNGGAQSAKQAASAAGNSIGTGAGGDRSTPDSPAAFARLLSGTFFGALLTIIFGGALFVQVWHYFERFGGRGQDRFWLQVMVSVIIVFSLMQSAFLIHRVWDIHVANFGNFAFPLLTVGWEIAASFVCIGINCSVIQSYYVHRLWLAFNKNRMVLFIYAPLVLYTFAGGVSSAVLILQAGSAANVKGEALHSFQPKSIPWEFSVVFATWLCCTAAIEISICLSLILQLTKVSTPFFHTRHALARLLLLSLETSIATTTFALISMILFLAIPYQFYYNITFLPIGQVSACSFLVTLMARPSIARELAQDQTLTLEGGLEAASSRAPNSIAKPVVKRMMRKEWSKRPQGDGTGVNLTVTVHEEASNGYYNDNGEKSHKMSPTQSFAYTGDSDNGTFDQPKDNRSVRIQDIPRNDGSQNTGNHVQYRATPAVATNFLDAVVTGTEGVGIDHMAKKHTKAQNKSAGLTSAGAHDPASSHGITPRGRVVPSPAQTRSGETMRYAPSNDMYSNVDENTSDDTVA